LILFFSHLASYQHNLEPCINTLTNSSLQYTNNFFFFFFLKTNKGNAANSFYGEAILRISTVEK
jgi:hypothetical protein